MEHFSTCKYKICSIKKTAVNLLSYILLGSNIASVIVIFTALPLPKRRELRSSRFAGYGGRAAT